MSKGNVWGGKMSEDVRDLKFLVTEEKGEVSALYLCPKAASALLVLGHGAGTNMRYALIQELAEHLFAVGIATFRYNYPYSEKGRGGMDGERVRLATVRAAVASAAKQGRGLPLFAGGHSMSGRMTSMAAAQEPLTDVEGIVFFAFPLHPARKPAMTRAEHLGNVRVPMLFLSGSCDEFAQHDLLKPTVTELGKQATLYTVDKADHGFKIRERSWRQSEKMVMNDLARATSAWMVRQIAA